MNEQQRFLGEHVFQGYPSANEEGSRNQGSGDPELDRQGATFPSGLVPFHVPVMPVPGNVGKVQSGRCVRNRNYAAFGTSVIF